MIRDQDIGKSGKDYSQLERSGRSSISRRDFLKAIGYSSISAFLFPLASRFRGDIGEQSLRETGSCEDLVLEKAVYTPPSLMLHSASFPLIKDLAPQIKDKYIFSTYRSYYESLVDGARWPKSPCLVSVDDLSPVYMNSNFWDMILLMQENGIIGTLGIVIGNREEWRDRYLGQLREFSKNGWELAIHTKSHVDLPSLSDDVLEKEIGDCWRDLIEISGVRPVTLILLFGDYWRGKENTIIDERIVSVSERYGLVWIVGIKGGKQFEGSPPYYVGRIPPGKTSSDTLAFLENSFQDERRAPLPIYDLKQIK